MLNVSLVQVRALVNTGELLGIQVGGRNVWRVEASELESYIQNKYEENRRRIEARRQAVDTGLVDAGLVDAGPVDAGDNLD
jgi:hypothetical protein